MPPPARNNNWKWFFAVLVVLSLVGSISLIVLNQRQQLTSEQFDAARKRWDAAGPANYVMVYTTRKNEETTTDHYVVKVRKKKTYEVLVNGSPLSEGLAYYGMDGLFNDIERFMEMEAKSKASVFRRATFDETTGAIRSYVRRVMGGRERLEITVDPLEPK